MLQCGPPCYAVPGLGALNIRAEMELERIARALIIIDVTTLAPFGPESGWKSCGFSTMQFALIL